MFTTAELVKAPTVEGGAHLSAIQIHNPDSLAIEEDAILARIRGLCHFSYNFRGLVLLEREVQLQPTLVVWWCK